MIYLAEPRSDSLAVLLGRPDDAIVHYGRAVHLRPENVEWRYELALLLKQQGRLDEAREQAQWCLRIDKHNPKHLELVDGLRVLATAAP
jgi:tetratricopeptide (TPR) repeat protein